MKKITSIRLTILLFTLFIVTDLFSQIPTTGLIAWYPFTGNANDMSGNNYSGTVYGATPTTDRFGTPNAAYDFDGVSNYISTGDIDLTDSFTISAWVLPRGVFGTIVSKYDATINSSYEFIYNNGTTGLYAHVGIVTDNNNDIYSNDTLSLNTWHHCVVERNRDTAIIYIDNILAYTQTGVNSTTLNNDTTLIGKSVWNGNFFNGKIDDLRIYNRPLSSTEIGILYNEGICFQTILVTDTLLINTNLTSFNPITYQNTIKIYPNPTHDHIIIDNGNYSPLYNGYTIKITNSLSQIMFQNPINTQQFNLNLASWTGAGLYFVYIIDGGGNIVDIRKIVLQ